MAKWLKLNKPVLKSYQFAELVNVTPEVISRWIAGSQRPMIEHAILIEDATDGAVTPRMWAEKISKLVPVKR